ncbi:MAG: molybdate ABC transporter substrate-binding protein [Planctomycetaceae bacterium]|nr:molybdate ABC transporter substrate-binding protein [Planctomycetaceae bacterium]
MRFRFGWIVAASALLIAGLIAAIKIGSDSRTEIGAEPLRFYCAAGIRKPVQEIIAEYEAEYGIPVESSYDGSGRLLSEIRAADDGDLYLAADVAYTDEARSFGIIDEVANIAEQRPCLAIRKDSGLEDITLQDLAAGTHRLSVADPKSAAVGRAARKMLAETKVDGVSIWDPIFEKATVVRHTVNEIANDIKSGAADIGIIWDATAAQYEDLTVVPVSQFEGSPQRIVISVLTASKQPTRALHFLRYLTSQERGLKNFKKYGYETVAGDSWSESPEVRLFTGGLMHPAIQETITAFEQREGVRVLQTPNGCGILVSQIRAGEHPDLYFACDTTFMTKVEDIFPQWEDLSKTEMVMVVNPEKAKELDVSSLNDLATKPLKIGLCDPEHSALGDLTRQLLEQRQLWASVQPKVLDWPSTADRLVESVVINGLDAAIVYRANTTRQKDALVVIDIDSPRATAIQPIAVAKDSSFPNLMGRLILKLKSADSKQQFESRGFRWIGGGTL